MQRDESALAALYDRYAGMLSSVLNRILRDTQAAEEILQDIFYQLWRTASRFDASRGSLAGWLMVIARNRAISRLREHNPTAGEELSENSVVLPLNLESSVAQQELLGRVKGALESCRRSSAPCSSSRTSQGMTHSEIAQRTGDPLGTVKTRLRSAIETLKRTLQPEYDERRTQLAKKISISTLSARSKARRSRRSNRTSPHARSARANSRRRAAASR